MPENVNVQTGEVMPYIDGTPVPVALAEMARMLTYVEQFVKEILKEGEDYDQIPGTKKKSLLQPGAEKIKFAFGLEDQYSTTERFVDPDREWTYTASEWTGSDGNRKKVDITKTARGYFRYEVRCDLIHRKSGTAWGSCIGVCESSERGRETSPANTIIKMAQKRAFVGASKSAAFLSGRFTCDVEDYRGDQAVGGQAPGGDHDGPKETIPEGCDKTMASRPKEDGSLGFCWTCKKKHIKGGDQIHRDAATQKWHAAECWEKKHPTEKPADRPADTSAEPAETTPKDGPYLDQAKRGEAAYVALFDHDEQIGIEAELVEARLTMLKAKLNGEPTSNLGMASPGTLKVYVGWLKDSVNAKKAKQ